MGDYIGDYHRASKGDTRSLDYSSCRVTYWFLARNKGNMI